MIREFKFFSNKIKNSLTIEDFTEYDGLYYVGNYYEVHGSYWVTKDRLESLLRFYPDGFRWQDWRDENISQ